MDDKENSPVAYNLLKIFFHVNIRLCFGFIS